MEAAREEQRCAEQLLNKARERMQAAVAFQTDTIRQHVLDNRTIQPMPMHPAKAPSVQQLPQVQPPAVCAQQVGHQLQPTHQPPEWQSQPASQQQRLQYQSSASSHLHAQARSLESKSVTGSNLGANSCQRQQVAVHPDDNQSRTWLTLRDGERYCCLCNA